MSDLIGEWCEYHHNLHNISPARRTMQLRVLRTLEGQLPGSLRDVCARDVERYMAQMIRDGYHPHTVVRDLALIRPFLRWMWLQQLIDAERWLRIVALRGPRGAYDGAPRPYSPQEIRQFWLELEKRYPWTRDHDPKLRTAARGEHWVRRWAAGASEWKRVYPYARRLQVEAIVSLALFAGLRRDEIYHIAIEDMHYQNAYVLARSRKGAEGHEKTRKVAMNKSIRLAVGNWLEFREQVLAPDHEHPWLCLWDPVGVTARMSHTQFQELLADMGRGWEYHRLRHTFATASYEAGMPVEILQVVLGHASVTQTLAYARISTDRIIDAANAVERDFLTALRPPPSTSDSNQEAA